MNKTILLPIFAIGLLASCSAQKPENAKPQKQVSEQINQQNTGERLDKREILPLNQMQRAHVLAEMRGLLVATQGIIAGLANDDMEAIASAAASAGMKSRRTVENQQNMQRLQMGKVLPQGFRQMGRAAHMGMDEIAEMAKNGKSAKDIQLKLADIMNGCIACHSTYQIPNP